MQARKTHFEQVPLEVAKEVATREAECDRRTSPRNWQDIAKEVTREQDSSRMVELVEELNKALEKQRSVLRGIHVSSDGPA